MKKRFWSRVDQNLTITAAVVIFFAVAITGSLLPERGGPDERHHIAHIAHVAGSDLSPYLDYENVFTDLDQLNHLIHPPAYYVLAGTVVRNLIPISSTAPPHTDERLEGFQLTTDEVYFNLRSQVSKIARLISLALMVWALYLALQVLKVIRYSCQRRHSSGAFFLLLTLGNPAAVLITSVANNDALVLPITFLLALSTLRIALNNAEPQWTPYVHLLGISVPLAILTKATLWPLSIALIFVALGILWVRDRHKLHFSWRPKNFRILGNLRWLARLLLTVVLWTWAISYLLLQKTKFGSFQPSYGAVYGRTTPGKFTTDVPPEPGFLNFLGLVASKGYKSLAGFMGQQERFYEPIGLSIIVSALMLFCVALILAVRVQSKELRVVGFFIMALPTFLLLFALRAWPGYSEGGYYASQGRYFLPYLIFSAVGILVLISLKEEKLREASGHFPVKLFQFSGVGLLMIVSLQVTAPFKYISNTEVFSSVGGQESAVAAQLDQLGNRMSFLASGSERFINRVEETGRFELAWTGSVVELFPDPAWESDNFDEGRKATLFVLVRPSTSGTAVIIEGGNGGCDFRKRIEIPKRGWYGVELPNACGDSPHLLFGRASDFPKPGSVTLEKAVVIDLANN